MRRCASCGSVALDGWTCSSCGFAPERDRGILSFAPEEAGLGHGFDPASFAHLARLEEDSFWFKARNRLIVWAMERYFAGAQSFLEVGCGTGYVLTGLHQARPELRIAGADLFIEGIAYAQERLPETEFFQLDATRIPFSEEWDAIGAFDVLEHVDGDERFLEGMHAAVKPGGGLLITVPQHPWLWSAADDYARHVRRYRRAELVAKVERAGFVVDRVSSFVSLLLPALWFSRLRDRRSSQPFDPEREHEAAAQLGFLERVLDVERAAIRRGFDWPAGGSLLLVGHRS